jgi:hypothetical protein
MFQEEVAPMAHLSSDKIVPVGFMVLQMATRVCFVFQLHHIHQAYLGYLAGALSIKIPYQAVTILGMLLGGAFVLL